jgi:transposase
MSCDKKYREAVLRHVDEGHSLTETRKIFNLGANTISQWKILREETGSLGNRPLERSWRKIDPEKLRADVEERPDDFNDERALRFGCSGEAIRQALKKQKITLKKNGGIRRTK